MKRLTDEELAELARTWPWACEDQSIERSVLADLVRYKAALEEIASVGSTRPCPAEMAIARRALADDEDCALSDALADLGRYKAALEEIAYRKTTRGRQPSARVIARQALEKEQLTCPTCGEPLREMHRGLPYCPPCEFQADQNMADDEEGKG